MKTLIDNLKHLFKNKYFVGFVILAALLIFVEWIIFGRTPVQDIYFVSSAVVKTVTPSAASQTAVTQEAAVAQNLKDSETVAQFDPKSADDAEFKRWFAAEVNLMNQYNVNEDSVQARYQQIAARMTPDQFSQLAEIAGTKTPNISERVLASYLLSYSGYSSLKDLGSFAKSNFHPEGNPTAHSVAETQLVQERALRILAIDRFVTLAKGSDAASAQKAKRELEDLISGIKDSVLKNYAQSKLKEISK